MKFDLTPYHLPEPDPRPGNPQAPPTTLRPYAWPGGYPLFYYTKDCDVLYPSCAFANQEEIIGAEVNWEADISCSECSVVIEMAYPPDEESNDDDEIEPGSRSS